MYPYLVETDVGAVVLYKSNDGRFQIVKQGKLFSYLKGCEYILVDSELACYLESLNIPQIEFRDATIWDRESNQENRTFKELIVKNTIRSESFEDIELDGLQMYLYGRQNLFVSPELKEILGKSKFDCLFFSEGWSWFAA